MSDHIPFEIQVEIIKRLPVKSLIRFRSVSKPWKSLIDSSQFIADYSVPNSESHRLVVSCIDPAIYEVKCVLIDDDDTFPQRKCSLNVPLFFKLIKQPKIIGTSHGLLCLYGYYREAFIRLSIVVLWNPSIRKSVAIKVPNVLDSPFETVVGFGVCPHTNVPKLVKINFISYSINWESISCIPFQVEVFTLSSRAWRISLRSLPRKSICFPFSHTVLDGVIYWIAWDSTNDGDDYKEYYLFISFDLTSEEFNEICFPEYLSQPSGNVTISKLKDSLVVLGESENGEKTVYGVCVMEHGVPNSFRKLFSIDAPNLLSDPLLGLRENGEALLKTYNRDKESVGVEVYEPSSKQIKDLEIYGQVYTYFASSYTETLFLLDQPDSSIGL